MATQKTQSKRAATGPPVKASAYPYPSRFGSHACMQPLISHPDPKKVYCIDEFGDYETERSKLDNGLADPNRYAAARLDRLFTGGHAGKAD